ncbi:MAG: hypothetical protein WAX69_06720 [Victivallales bacterium]
MTRPEKAKVGIFLIGCQRFRKLGDGTKHGVYEIRKERYAETFVKQIGKIADPVFPGIAYGRNDVEKAMRMFFSEKVDCVICTFLSWSEDFSWISFLRDMYDIPLLLYLQAMPRTSYSDTRDEDDFVEFLAQGGLVGSLECSGSIARFGRKIEIVLDEPPQAEKRIDAFVRASHARAKLRNARFGLIPCYNEIMWSTYVSPYDIFAKIGPELKFISYAHLKEEIESIPDSDATSYMKDIASLYPVEKDVDKRLFLESARASLALATIGKRLELDALVLNDVSPELFRAIGLRPGFYHPSFNERNSVLVPEGDLGAGTIVYILKQLTGGHVNYTEPFYVNNAENTFSAGHAGPNDHTDGRFRKLVRVSRDVRFAKTSYKYAGAPFAWYRIPPGKKTFAHFSEGNGKYKIVCFTAESLPGKHTLCSYSHSDFRPDMPVTKLFEKVISTGTTQHFAVAEGDLREELSLFARINGFEYHEPGK